MTQSKLILDLEKGREHAPGLLGNECLSYIYSWFTYSYRLYKLQSETMDLDTRLPGINHSMSHCLVYRYREGGGGILKDQL